MAATHLPERSASTHLERDDDAAAVVDDDGRVLGALDHTAAALWELCDGRTTIDEMVEAVCAVWDVDAPTARRDVEAALDKMEAAGLISWSRTRA